MRDQDVAIKNGYAVPDAAQERRQSAVEPAGHCARWPRALLSARGSRRHYRFGFWAAAFAYLMLVSSITVPSPLYVIYTAVLIVAVSAWTIVASVVFSQPRVLNLALGAPHWGVALGRVVGGGVVATTGGHYGPIQPSPGLGAIESVAGEFGDDMRASLIHGPKTPPRWNSGTRRISQALRPSGNETEAH